MSKTISLKVQETTFAETEKLTKKLHIPRNRYINQALDYYNRINNRKLLKDRLRAESDLVKKDSLQVLEELEALEDDLLG